MILNYSQNKFFILKIYHIVFVMFNVFMQTLNLIILLKDEDEKLKRERTEMTEDIKSLQNLLSSIDPLLVASCTVIFNIYH